MGEAPLSRLPMMEENEATGEVAEIFDEIKRDLQIPFVPNIERAMAASPAALKGTWALLRHVFMETSLPMPLAAMILYSIAVANKCEYCSSMHKVTCRSIGIDEDILAALDSDLEALSPKRVQEIVTFAVKCATDRLNLTDEDYERVRAQGVSDQELTEIIALAALGNYGDTLADSLKIEVDPMIKQALQG